MNRLLSISCPHPPFSPELEAEKSPPPLSSLALGQTATEVEKGVALVATAAVAVLPKEEEVGSGGGRDATTKILPLSDAALPPLRAPSLHHHCWHSSAPSFSSSSSLFSRQSSFAPSGRASFVQLGNSSARVQWER